MFAPAFHLEDDDEGDEEQVHHNHGEEELVRVRFATRMPMIIKVKNCVLVLGLGVAVFIQFSTMDPKHLNTLMWGEQDENYYLNHFHDDYINLVQEENASSQILLLHWLWKTLQSTMAILMLVILRAVIFPNAAEYATLLETILADLLFHMQCRFVIGFLTCFTPIPFERTEAAVVVLSIALQTTTSTAIERT